MRTRLRALRVAALCMPGAAELLADAVRRGERFGTLDRLHRAGYLGAALVMTGVWAAALYVASWRRSRLRHVAAALFVVPYGVAFGVQAAFFSCFGVYCSLDAQIDSDSIPWSILGTLPVDRAVVVLHLAAGLAVAGTMLCLARAIVRPRRLPRPLRPVLLAVAAVVLAAMPVSWHKWQSSPPDLIYLHGLATLVRRQVFPPYVPLVRAQRRSPEPVPPLEARPARPRDVLFLLQESQRYDVSCVAYEPDCQLATRATNALLPARMPLDEMRS
ncbi:MAG TPA: hypothetical protein VHB21_24520, partial [Minicystis sp.]|nr:hypothetical protein [Minicystis sp.]